MLKAHTAIDHSMFVKESYSVSGHSYSEEGAPIWQYKKGDQDPI
jgi:hypothetical protein